MGAVYAQRLQKWRPRRWPFFILGLTGSVAMGKSTAGVLLRRMGLPVFDADAAVHDLTSANGRVVAEIAERFPEACQNGHVDRRLLGEIVFNDRAALRDLEGILHPKVRAARKQFFQYHALQRTRCVVLDIPLLYETQGQDACDAVLVVSAPAFLQRQRTLGRPGMSEEKFRGILARQTPDSVKRRLADRVIPSGLGKRETWRHLKTALHAFDQAQSGLSLI